MRPVRLAPSKSATNSKLEQEAGRDAAVAAAAARDEPMQMSTWPGAKGHDGTATDANVSLKRTSAALQGASDFVKLREDCEQNNERKLPHVA
jgi:hypothetical protein